jgi:hypothetical protein
VISPIRRFLARLTGTAALPSDFSGVLGPDEHVLAVAESRDGSLVATHLGLWVPDADEHRRIGWYLISKATWGAGALNVIEAEVSGEAGAAVLLRDRAVRAFALTAPGRLPEVVHDRVTGSVRSRHHRELPGGGAWFVQRKVPGQDGILLQVRADPGTDEAALTEYATEAAEQLRRAQRRY